ncbi:GntR family transcriptional regulator [Novosphingobium sp. PhB165]|uniref:FadR/GntR family transcriptional regulator n=1 Tax=Novosphingobium sp. PhB165 TaxID=2485105 RepID=UPI0010435594|nr:FadR/GntR family transcriptional regulator [Novosphingobium sp. PhB165]TCM20683.1 GntR family transcriptional regulator [Novosphingobium sp. PhB165]
MAIGEKLYHRVAGAIEEGICSGRYPEGTRLPGERDLAEEFGVSRPTIREAMIALEIRGLVSVRHGSGLFVMPQASRPRSAPELDVGAFELIEARILFEGEAAALAATAIDAPALERLGLILDEMDSGSAGHAQRMDADREFHLLIAEATGNSLVLNTVETLWNVREQSPLCAHMFDKARREGVTPRVDEHRLIVEALRNKDADGARRAMRAHLKRVSEDVLEATELELIEQARSEIEAHRNRLARRV